MTRDLPIMVSTELSLEEFVHDLNRLWHMAAQPASDEFGTWYEYTDEDIYITIGTHEFVNDRDLHFEDYRSILGSGPGDVIRLTESNGGGKNGPLPCTTP